MKKSTLSILLHLYIFTVCYAQYDANWVLGYVSSAANNTGKILHFEGDSLSISFFKIKTNIISSSVSLSDEFENLMLYTNGCGIYDKSNNLILNGDSINSPGVFFEENCITTGSYWVHQGLLGLPSPEQESIIELFTLRFDRDYHGDSFYFPTSIVQTTIDATDSSKVEVIEKNKLLAQDTFCDHLMGVRHGNGRDWWLFVPKLNSDIAYAFLLTKNGTQGPFIKKMPLFWKGQPNNYQLGKACFSSDGTKYVRVDNVNQVHLYCFDRCNGEFSCPIKIPISFIDFDGGGSLGAAFSKNGRFLYVTATKRVLQYDTWSQDVNSTKVVIGEFDGYDDNWPTAAIYQPQLAPDGKIYITAYNTTPYLHSINKPDEKGLACDFQLRTLNLQTAIGVCLPNYPNYNLYDFQNSPCDTLGIDSEMDSDSSIWVQKAVALFPNPADSYFQTNTIECARYSVLVFDCLGKLIFEKYGIDGKKTEMIKTSHWASGSYFVHIQPEHKLPIYKKIIISH